MGEAVEQGGRHLGITKDGGPFAEAEVGGYDDAGALVKIAQQVEQQGSTRCTERQVSQLIQDGRRSSATRRRVSASSTIGPLPRNGMRIVRPSAQRSASSQSTPSCATTFRIGCPGSLPHRTASPSMGPSWYGKGDGPFSGRADAGHLPGVRSRSREPPEGRLPQGSDHAHQP